MVLDTMIVEMNGRVKKGMEYIVHAASDGIVLLFRPANTDERLCADNLMSARSRSGIQFQRCSDGSFISVEDGSSIIPPEVEEIITSCCGILPRYISPSKGEFTYSV